MTLGNPPALTDLAYRAIRRDIVTCALPPGATVSEATLAQAHGLTLAPVRTALARLRAEGLLIGRPRSGHVVAPVTVEDALEIYALRRLLQGHGAAEAAGKVRIPELQALDQACLAVEGDRTSIIAANAAFHMAVMTAAGSPRLARMVAELLDLSERIHHLGLSLRDDRPLAPWRQPLIHALTASDRVRAQRVMWDHLDDVRGMTLEALLHHPDLRRTILSMPQGQPEELCIVPAHP